MGCSARPAARRTAGTATCAGDSPASCTSAPPAGPAAVSGGAGRAAMPVTHLDDVVVLRPVRALLVLRGDAGSVVLLPRRPRGALTFQAKSRSRQTTGTRSMSSHMRLKPKSGPLMWSLCTRAQVSVRGDGGARCRTHSSLEKPMRGATTEYTTMKPTARAVSCLLWHCELPRRTREDEGARDGEPRVLLPQRRLERRLAEHCREDCQVQRCCGCECQPRSPARARPTHCPRSMSRSCSRR